MVTRLITTLVVVFIAIAVFVTGSVTGNTMINGEDPALTMMGFGMYLGVGILEILIGYVLYKIWS